MEENSESSSLGVSPPRKRKRGVVNKSKYKSETIKLARIKGKAYTNWKGQSIPAAKPGDNCMCKKNCYGRINEEERINIFNRFLTFNTKNEQDAYLHSLISVSNIKRHRPRNTAEGSKSKPHGASYEYHVSTLLGKYTVCKKAFGSIHGIKPDRIRRLCNLVCQGKVPVDNRGKSTPGNAKPGHVIQTIREHIESYPQKITHYGNKEYKYLSADLNVKIMYSMFKAKHPSLNDMVSYHFYLKVFKEQFDLKFGRPQVDTCCTCEELDVKIKSKFLNDNAKRVAVAEKMVHLRRARKFYDTMKTVAEEIKKDESGKIGGICIDYMQNIDLPRIPVQETFYLRQLTVNVFCIHNLRDDSAHFVVYHEGIAGKGPNEVSTFLHEYFKQNMGNVEYLHVFSDGCGGQNKNHTIVRLMSSLVSMKIFKDIKQYFPIRGHSFLPCDRDFAILKRKIRRSDRFYTVKEVAELILSAGVTKNFLVVLPTHKDILNYKNWWPKYYKKKMLSLESLGRNVARDKKVSFNISQYNFFHHNENFDGIVEAREYIGGLSNATFPLKNTSKALMEFPTEPASMQKRPINKKKMIDLQKLKTYLPQTSRVQKFYATIFKWPVTDKECEEHYGG